MGSTPGGGRRPPYLKIAFVLAGCFAAGLIAAGTVAGAGPLAALSALSSATDSTDTTSTDTTSTDSTSSDTTSSDTTSAAPTDTSPTDTTPSDTTPTDSIPTSTETTPVSAPTISSDQADYAPGSNVTLTGADWAAGEAVHLFVNDDQGKTWSYSADVAADSSGAFTHHFQLPTSFVATYAVVATGATSGTASASFTDGNLSIQLATADQATPAPSSFTVSYLAFNTGTTCSGSGTSQTSGTLPGNIGFRR